MNFQHSLSSHGHTCDYIISHIIFFHISREMFPL